MIATFDEDGGTTKRDCKRIYADVYDVWKFMAHFLVIWTKNLIKIELGILFFFGQIKIF